MVGIKITDAAKLLKLLLDTILETKSVTTALSEFCDKHMRLNGLPKSNFYDLEEMIRALEYICDQGRQQAAKVSPVSNLLRGYDKRRKADGSDDDSRPYHVKTSLGM